MINLLSFEVASFGDLASHEKMLVSLEAEITTMSHWIVVI